MTLIAHVDYLYESPDPKYPRFLPGHPRNAHVDWATFSDYAETGSADDPVPYSLFIKAKGRLDAVWIGGIVGPLVSAALREAMTAVAGEDLEFLPVTVNDEPYWILRVATMIDALNADLTVFRYGPNGELRSISHPVFDASRLRDPQMFTVPQQPRGIWATPSVGEAYRRSGCNGLNFFPRGEVV